MKPMQLFPWEKTLATIEDGATMLILVVIFTIAYLLIPYTPPGGGM